MNNKKDTGVYQLDNGYWAYRYKMNIDGVVKEKRRRTMGIAGYAINMTAHPFLCAGGSYPS